MRLTPEQMRRVVHAVSVGRDPTPPPVARVARKSARAARKPDGAPLLAKEHAHWWTAPNVVGLCFAPKVRNGRVDDLALQVLVRLKRPRHRVPERRRIPEFVRVDGLGLRGRVPTDVREVGTPWLESFISDARPVLPGFNISHRRGGSGTLGCAVRALDTGELLGLSCAHVLGNFGLGAPGDRVLAPSEEEARDHGGLAAARFGTLVRMGPLVPGREQAPSNVDAATVRPDSPELLGTSIAVLNVEPTVQRDDVPLCLPVRLVGSTSEQVSGTVAALHLTIGLPYPTADGGTQLLWFTDQLGVTSCTNPGDSGALVLDDTGAAVGLHQAAIEGLSVCTPIRRVLDSVGCTLPSA
ncbi:hypothetical protein JY651_32395 [Pyxidicoccus parkwayensis]|uniref:Serine protease n=1 Tax=Pyxidicoccus parkwayensis TaxID=2813578 RepID=A0ABX7NM87_9BACT|nr:hypothetical protein [Pyxidicoccus parkwaysis]QSQ19962.1 hypothetical protein JY651_32395 [Pyxidicoccus parkwaysis]